MGIKPRLARRHELYSDGDEEEDEKQSEKRASGPRKCAGCAAEPEDACNKRDHQTNQGPIQHENTPHFSPLQRAMAATVPREVRARQLFAAMEPGVITRVIATDGLATPDLLPR